jgi:hypothetical protein
MTEITTEPPVEKKATFILFSTKEKLTLTELKMAFRVKKGRLISTKGKNWQIGNLFDRLFAIKNSLPDEGEYFNFDQNKKVTHIYIVAQRSCTTSFGLLKYFDQFLGGYDTSPSALEQLQDLIEEYGEVAAFSAHGKASISHLNKVANQIVQIGLGSCSKIDNLCTQLQDEVNEFAMPNLGHAKEKINLWCEQHHWTHIDSQDKAQNDLQTQLAA